MCGEKAGMAAAGCGIVGSPPHVRGKVAILVSRDEIRRITPACAGKSAITASLGTHLAGSPPHVRGKVEALHHGRAQRGITPACAGKRQT